MPNHDDMLELSEALNRTLGVINKLADAVILLSARVKLLEGKDHA